MDYELSNMRPSPESVAAGLMTESVGEAMLTEAGLFALAGTLAYDVDAESREHCLSGFLRALSVARTGGLDEQTDIVILWAFAENITPGDGSAEGTDLAKLCRLVAELVGAGRMSDVIAGKKAH